MYISVNDLIMVYALKDGICCCDMFFFQAEDGIRDLVRSRGLGDVYKRQQQIRNYYKLSDPDDLKNLVRHLPVFLSLKK